MWIAINVAKHGKIVYTSVPSVLYRQHSSNYSGSCKKTFRRFIKDFCHFRRQFSIYRRVYEMAKQSESGFSPLQFVKAKMVVLMSKFLKCF